MKVEILDGQSTIIEIASFADGDLVCYPRMPNPNAKFLMKDENTNFEEGLISSSAQSFITIYL